MHCSSQMISQSPGGVRFAYVQECRDQLLADSHVLAVISFDGETGCDDDPRFLATGLKQLMGSKTHEVWYSDRVVHKGRDNSLSWSDDGSVMFCSAQISVDEDSFAEAVESVYSSMLTFINERGYPHVARAWNFMSDINLGDGDQERYKQFCLGRHAAFARSHVLGLGYPAACAIGHDGGDAVIYVLATKVAGEHFENPAQMAAFEYPRQYGPKSPSFARATLVRHSASSAHLYVSGTASVKGHETVFPGDLQKQLSVTLDNLQVLMNHVSEKNSRAMSSLNMLKVYLRDPAYLDYVQRQVQERMPGMQALFLRGDICRADLEIEIDGLCVALE